MSKEGFDISFMTRKAKARVAGAKDIRPQRL